MRRKRVLALVAAVVAPACSLAAGLGDYDVPEKRVKDGGVDGAVATVDGEAPVVEDAGGGIEDAADDGWAMGVDLPPPPTGCEVQTPDDSVGVFVSTGGNDNAACTRTAPCKSIQKGIDTAAGTGKTKVYVDGGEYTESITLKANVTVQGGWDFAGGFKRICDGMRAAKVVIKGGGTCPSFAPSASFCDRLSTIAVRASGAGAGLDTLTVVEFKPWKESLGESIYGIFATASTTLNDVIVDVKSAGRNGGPGGNNGNSNTINCSTTGTLDSAPGTPGQPATATVLGMFGDGGYERASGHDGNQGTSGNPSGTVAGETSMCTISCPAPTIVVEDAGAGDPAEAGTTLKCDSPGTQMSKSASPSSVGCGGGPGLGGAHGGGGGSSIALYAFGNITVKVVGGALGAGAAGNGGTGGTGGSGANGTTGNAGANYDCYSSCILTGTSCVKGGMTTLRGGGQNGNGTPGTGGKGGAGSFGTGGAGGYSYAVYQGTGSTITVDPHGAGDAPVVLGFGTPGIGGNPGGPNGVAASRGP